MQARIMAWQSLAKDKNAQRESFEIMQKNIREEQREKMRLEQIKLKLLQVPIKYRNKSFDDFHVDYDQQSCIKQLAMRYVESAPERVQLGTSLCFVGYSGTGKTLLSLIIYQALAQSGMRVQYEPTLQFVQDLIALKYQSNTLYRQQIDVLAKMDLLILDEISESVTSRGKPSDIEKQILFHIINDRYLLQKPTIIISNQSMQGLTESLSARITDRLTEGGIVMAFNWPSYRGKKGAI